MTDLLTPDLISLSVPLCLLGAAVILLFELRRRIESFKEKESRLPDACRLPGLTEEVSRLTEQRHAFQKDIDDAYAVIARKQAVEQWLEQNLVTYERVSRELPEMRAEFESLTKQRETVRDQSEQLREEMRQLQQDSAPHRLLIERKQQAEKWLNENLARYEENLSRYELVQRELPQLNEQFETVQANLLDLRKKRDEIVLEEQQAEQQRKWLLNENLARCEQVQRELSLLTDQFETLQANLLDLRKKRDEIVLEEQQAEQQRKWLLDENRRLNGVIAGQVTEQTKRHSETSTGQATLTGLLEQIAAQSVQRDVAEKFLANVEHELQKKKNELEHLQHEQAEAKAEWETKFAELGGIQQQLQDVNRLLEVAEQRWTQIAPTVGVNDVDRLAELWKPAIARTAFTTPAKEDEQASLSRTSNYLEQLGIRFHERVLHAFHTSLKIAEMSPLVVLAGISGTGKSELPRRYAEGMGLHFLSLAVQPRWDSPQDILGFFNFLENRYHATELGRALVQMDRFFDAPERGWNFPKEWRAENLSERLLLVLLDEMNLARVEYYFSEFLSRLEIRRGIASENPHERRKAEIALEVGFQSLQAENGQVQVRQQPTLQLFVDRNVLFVGTMNEDETTQALSDKVVDRANVLRFGRPFKLRPGAVQNPPKPTENWLPYESWKSWTRDSEKLDRQIRDEVSGWIQTLNEAMQSIGRPFAHRTFAAMLAYIANYPDPSAYKLAMADQIEQKLLPKFRGLDLQDTSSGQALGTIQALLGKLGDEQLQDAVRKSQQQNERPHQFSWLGVDRLGTT